MPLIAERAGTRVQARPTYRTVSRMQRRCSRLAAHASARHRGDPAWQAPEHPGAGPPAAGPAEPAYLAELRQLAQLRDAGVLTASEFDAKKKQLLGI